MIWEESRHSLGGSGALPPLGAGGDGEYPVHRGQERDEVSVARDKQSGVGSRKGSGSRGSKDCGMGSRYGFQAWNPAPPHTHKAHAWHSRGRSYRRWLGRPGDRVHGSPGVGAAGGPAHPAPCSGSTHSTSGPSWTTKERRLPILTSARHLCFLHPGLRAGQPVSQMQKLRPRGQEGLAQGPPGQGQQCSRDSAKSLAPCPAVHQAYLVM